MYKCSLNLQYGINHQLRFVIRFCHDGQLTQLMKITVQFPARQGSLDMSWRASIAHFGLIWTIQI